MMSSPEPKFAKSNLVIVRSGNASLHSHWMNEEYSKRSWDIVVSYYDRAAFDVHGDEPGVVAVYQPGGKWDGLFKTVLSLGEMIDRYDYIWLPDDDILTDGETINRLFALMKQHGLAIGQPSLSAESYFTHFLCINSPGLKLRYTNYVEIMVPCLEKGLLKAILPDFSDTMSGFGLDYIWCRLPASGKYRAAILDDVVVRHTRPVGKFLASKMNEKGISPKTEEARLRTKYGIAGNITPLAYGAIATDGTLIHGQVRTGLKMIPGHLRVALFKSGAHYGLRKILQLIRRQLTKPLDLAILGRGNT